MNNLQRSSIDSMADRARNADLNRHLAQQEAADHRAELVEARTKQLMDKGEDYHPWTFENFTEAIENAPEAERKMMFNLIAAAVDLGLNNDHGNHMALVGLRQLVERYCTKGAAARADAEDYEL